MAILLIIFAIGTPWALLYLFRLINPLAPQRFTGPLGSDLEPFIFDSGFGWLGFHTQRLNRICYRLLKFMGAMEAKPGRDPKRFDPESSPSDRRRGSRTRSAYATLVAFYDLGTIVILLLQILALFALGLLFFQFVCNTILSLRTQPSLVHHHSLAVSDRTKGLVRRSISNEPNGPIRRAPSEIVKSKISLKPLIPGITIPMDQLPIYLSALIVSQAFHEFGHAFVAALNNVPVVASGFVIAFPLIPIFYVSIAPLLPPISHPNSRLLSLLNLRVATAGLWHNVVMASVGWVLWNDGANVSGWLLRWSGGWTDVGNIGLGVVSVQKASAISSVIFVDDIITHLDDFPLGFDSASSLPDFVPRSPLKRWEYYLLSNLPSLGAYRQGWCMPYDILSDMGNHCCHSGVGREQNTINPSLVCFKASSQSACLDPAMMSQMVEASARCRTDQDCGGMRDAGCVREEEESNLLRLNVTTTRGVDSHTTRIVFFQGAKLEVLRSVQVSRLVRTFDWIPSSLETHLQSFYNYLLSLSIGIGFLNLLPIRRLDGIAIAHSLIHFHASIALEGSSQEISDEADIHACFGHVRPSHFDAQIKCRDALESSWISSFVSIWRFGSVLSRLERVTLGCFLVISLGSFWNLSG